MTTQVKQNDSSIPLGRYRHYKGREYEVLGLARHADTEEVLVVYKCLYGDFSTWVRSRSDFEESVELGGETIPRFVFMGSEVK